MNAADVPQQDSTLIEGPWDGKEACPHDIIQCKQHSNGKREMLWTDRHRSAEW
jgi:hypothetical protein